MRDTVFKLESLIPQINEAVGIAAADIDKSKEIVKTVQTQLPKAAQLAQDGEAFAKQLSTFLDLDTAGPLIKQDLELLLQASYAVEELTAILQDANIDPEVVKAALTTADNRLTGAITVTNGMIALAIFAGIALLNGLALKKWINRYSAKMLEKAKESGIIH